jgi:hypothetical protein
VGKGLSPRFAPGDRVRVLRNGRPGHLRTPAYVQGATGEVVRYQGDFANPEERAYGHDGNPVRPVYLLRFRSQELWPEAVEASADEVYLDIYEHWLREADEHREY